MPAERVPVDVNVGEIVIRADGLNLGERVLQRTPIPKPNVLDRWSIVLEVERFDRGLHIKVTLLNSINAEGAACRRNVVIDVRRLASQLIRLHDEVSHVRGNDDGADNIND